MKELTRGVVSQLQAGAQHHHHHSQPRPEDHHDYYHFRDHYSRHLYHHRHHKYHNDQLPPSPRVVVVIIIIIIIIIINIIIITDLRAAASTLQACLGLREAEPEVSTMRTLRGREVSWSTILNSSAELHLSPRVWLVGFVQIFSDLITFSNS